MKPAPAVARNEAAQPRQRNHRPLPARPNGMLSNAIKEMLREPKILIVFYYLDTWDWRYVFSSIFYR